eukprot:10000374-Karenia_brevis.AAC.1
MAFGGSWTPLDVWNIPVALKHLWDSWKFLDAPEVVLEINGGSWGHLNILGLLHAWKLLKARDAPGSS